MSRHHEWLREEVAQWRAEGVVDEALAQRILARYPEGGRGWARMAFSAIGAVLIGLGVILFFAYNWADLPKAAKLALVFGALIAAHGAAMLAGRAGAAASVVEGLHALGTMLFGAGIWLVAQIYHVDEHYPNAFVIWSLGALALAWAMPSIVQGLLALFLVSFWAGVELFEFHAPMHGAPMLVALGVVPLAWWRRSPALLFWSLAVLVLVTAFAAGALDGDALLSLLYIMGAALLLGGAAAPATKFPDAAGPLEWVGLLVVLGCAYLASYPDVVGILGHVDFARRGTLAYFAVAGVALIVAAAGFARAGRAGLDRHRRVRLALMALGLAAVLFMVMTQTRSGGWPMALWFNAIVLGFAASLIAEGADQLRPRLVAAGCLVFAVVAVSRYTDLFTSLLVRAAVFVALGAGLFLVGNFYARQRRRAQEGQP